MALDLKLDSLTEQQKRIVQVTYESNPTASLQELSDALNNLPELMTCFVDFTPEFLKSLKYKERKSKSASGKDKDDSNASDNGHGQLTQSRIRAELESRHVNIKTRLDNLLAEKILTGTQAKTFEMLSKIDEKLVSQILDLMQQESAPLLPQATIIRCLRKLGVSEEELNLIDASLDI